LKGRFDEDTNPAPDRAPERDLAPPLSRGGRGLIETLNRLIPAGQTKLYAPDMRFHRRSAGTWERRGRRPARLTPQELRPAPEEALPSTADVAAADAILKSNDWIAAK
jgi:hypothetical protein